MKEIWKDIKGYEGLYQVSNLGRIKSLKRYRKNNKSGYVQEEKIIKTNKTKKYEQVRLSKDGKAKTYTIHRIVAKAFLDKIAGKEYVNHKDGNKHNNSIDNLEWCTSSENQQHALATGLRNKNAKSIKIVQKDLKNRRIKIWESLMEASRQTNISEGSISLCINKKELHIMCNSFFMRLFFYSK